MAQARIVLLGDATQPGYEGAPRAEVEAPPDARWQIAGLPDGTTSGNPILAFWLDLPDGKRVFWNVTWRSFAIAFWRFAALYGEKPDTAGMRVVGDVAGIGAPIALDILPESEQGDAFFECELCGTRRRAVDFDGATIEEQQMAMLAWVGEHFREKHPDWTPPETR